MVNLSSFIRYHASRTPDRLAIVFKDQRVTYAEFLRRIETTGSKLPQGYALLPEYPLQEAYKKTAKMMGYIE